MVQESWLKLTINWSVANTSRCWRTVSYQIWMKVRFFSKLNPHTTQQRLVDEGFVRRAQPQRIAFHTSKDGKGFVRISFKKPWSNYSRYAKCTATYHYHHHNHHVVPLAQISLILSRHFSLSFIASGRSPGLHPVSSHSKLRILIGLFEGVENFCKAISWMASHLPLSFRTPTTIRYANDSHWVSVSSIKSTMGNIHLYIGK